MYCLVSIFYLYKNNFVGNMSTLIIIVYKKSSSNFKADLNIVELNLHRRTVSIKLLINLVSMLYIYLYVIQETHTIKYLD